MTTVETHPFRRRIDTLLSSEGYRLLQLELSMIPDAGTRVPGSGGIRKLRWNAGGKGKRGGMVVQEEFA